MRHSLLISRSFWYNCKILIVTQEIKFHHLSMQWTSMYTKYYGSLRKPSGCWLNYVKLTKKTFGQNCTTQMYFSTIMWIFFLVVFCFFCTFILPRVPCFKDKMLVNSQFSKHSFKRLCLKTLKA